MNPTPKTIQIFLPGGDPLGIRIAEITARVEVPGAVTTAETQTLRECWPGSCGDDGSPIQ